MKNYWPLFFCFLMLGNAFAQSSYTRQDSLRGKLTPLRTCYDVVFYNLNLRVNPNEKSINGYNTIHYKTISDFNQIQIDLFENMKIEKIVHQKQNLKFTREGNATFIQFKETQKKDKKDSIIIYYSGQPQVAVNPPWDGGFTWSKDLKGNTWIGVSCEGLGASVWWPNKDHLSDEPDSMRIACEVPSDLICVANGNLRQKQILSDNYTRYDWFVSYPINNYNVTLNIAKYVHFQDVYTAQDGEKLALDYYVLPYNLEKAKKQFEQVKPMLACYEKYFGKYPFWKDGYAMVETPYLGMEHQGAIAYGNEYKQGYKGYDISGSGIGNRFDYIIIHETGHEYWGNNVSCKDHAEMWIHEGFCTYSEALYVECMYGKPAADDYLFGYRGGIRNQDPMIAPLDVNAEATSDIYPKGAVVLHTLRNVLNNDNTWFDILKGLNLDFRFKTVDSQDIINYINKKAGQDLTYFFQQYLYRPEIPTLEYKIKESKDKGQFEVEYRWANCHQDFKMPIQLHIGEGKFQTIQPNTTWQKLNLKLPDGAFKLKAKSYYVNLRRL
jgi:aminopeptidase N